ncbi:MAG: hypothetical protein JKY37_09690 [Nannocystaceae bacterium]|nr:hypothetical protein [Nannocystaceae bacterium]
MFAVALSSAPGCNQEEETSAFAMACQDQLALDTECGTDIAEGAEAGCNFQGQCKGETTLAQCEAAYSVFFGCTAEQSCGQLEDAILTVCQDEREARSTACTGCDVVW